MAAAVEARVIGRRASRLATRKGEPHRVGGLGGASTVTKWIVGVSRTQGSRWPPQSRWSCWFSCSSRKGNRPPREQARNAQRGAPPSHGLRRGSIAPPVLATPHYSLRRALQTRGALTETDSTTRTRSMPSQPSPQRSRGIADPREHRAQPRPLRAPARSVGSRSFEPPRPRALDHPGQPVGC